MTMAASVGRKGGGEREGGRELPRVHAQDEPTTDGVFGRGRPSVQCFPLRPKFRLIIRPKQIMPITIFYLSFYQAKVLHKKAFVFFKFTFFV